MVYRSPSVPRATLTTLLTRLLTHVTLSTTPCVIVGDLNEDIQLCQRSAILDVMSSFSFTQIVQHPTTPQATQIDHVYYRNTTDNSASVIVKVQDTYYSDHDTVYCSLLL